MLHSTKYSSETNRKGDYLERIAKINEENDFGSWNQKKIMRHESINHPERQF